MNKQKTIKQLADEIGVSKQTIQKIVEKIPTEFKPSKLGNKYLLSQDTQLYIKKKLGIQIDNNSDISDNKSDKIDIENEKIDNSNKETDNLNIDKYLSLTLKQLQIKDKQIEKLQKLLDQQQILTLQANKKIEALELKIEASDDQEPPLKESIQDEKKSFWARWFR